MVTIYEPSASNPYEINTNIPMVFRIACRGGVNRSTTLRQWLKTSLPEINIFYPPYGADGGNYKNSKITCIRQLHSDGFNELYGQDKEPNIQSMIFDMLNYPIGKQYPNETVTRQNLNEPDRPEYTKLLMEYFWKIDTSKKNIFVIINEHEDIIQSVQDQLIELNQPIDLVIIRMHDTIRLPLNESLEPYSKSAYEAYLKEITQFFRFV
jgi:hypothetical protein